MQKKVVIIGAGIAGVQAASSLAGSAEITLVNNEDFLPYYRMRIEEVLCGSDPQALFMHPLEWYEEKGIAIISGNVSGIIPDKMEVSLSDGRSLGYDELVIATGSQANIFPLEGGRKEYYSLRTMKDALSLKAALSKARSLAVIGGGLLGLELAAAVASHFPLSVSVVEVAPYILPRQLDEPSARKLESLLLERGVRVITGAKAKGADDSSLILEDGRRVDADVICFSSGVHADLSLLEGTGIETGRAIKVSDRLRTSVEGIYAIGDAAELDGRTFGLAMHAREMGSFVASVIKGEAGSYVPSVPSAMLKIGGLDVASLGSIEGEAHVYEAGDRRRTIFVKDGIVNGVVLIGEKATPAIKAMLGKPYTE